MGMLDRKVALVTGAGQGVGRGIALALAGEGAQIAVAGRTEGKLLETCAEIEGRGGRAVPIVCDVMIAADIERCVQQTVTTLGTVDILVNNAQVVPLGRLLDVTEEHYQEGMDSGPLATLRFWTGALVVAAALMSQPPFTSRPSRGLARCFPRGWT